MPCYAACCLHDEPTTPGRVSQCEGIENGTVVSTTGEYIGGRLDPLAAFSMHSITHLPRD